ncbi:unnamed protein product, partial [marine sediment metagenome]
EYSNFQRELKGLPSLLYSASHHLALSEVKIE